MKEEPYQWDTAASAPTNYPAQIYSGHLITGDTPTSGYAYLPFDCEIGIGAGLGANDGSSSDRATGKPPKSLDITWLSFTEKKSYSGIFKLDHKKIEDLIINSPKIPFWNKKTKKVDFYKGQVYSISTGLIPGGIVVVYVWTETDTTIAGRFQAQEDKNVQWKTAYEYMKDNSEINKLIEIVNKDLPQQVRDQIASGTIPLGYWDDWFKTYLYTPVVSVEDKVETLLFNYLNGERETIFLSLHDNIMPVRARAVPKDINIVWHDINSRRMETDIFFDEKKVRALFAQTKPNEKIQFVFTIDRNTSPRATQGINIKLKTVDKEIDLSDAITSQESFTKSDPY
jgi:Protein of unknown function (DUF2931)